MKIIKISNGVDKILQAEIDLIVEYLKRGEVIAYPTDTVYGLGCDARNAEAIKKISKIKGDRSNKPFIILVSDFKMLKKYCRVNKEQEKYLRKIWLKPHPNLRKERGRKAVTVILEKKYGKDKTGLAVRLPKNDFLIKIISEAGFPLVSTSLNKKGEKPLMDIKNLEKYFKYTPDLVIDAGEGKRVKPSRLVDIRDVKNIKIIRR